MPKEWQNVASYIERSEMTACVGQDPDDTRPKVTKFKTEFRPNVLL